MFRVSQINLIYLYSNIIYNQKLVYLHLKENYLMQHMKRNTYLAVGFAVAKFAGFHGYSVVA